MPINQPIPTVDLEQRFAHPSNPINGFLRWSSNVGWPIHATQSTDPYGGLGLGLIARTFARLLARMQECLQEGMQEDIQECLPEGFQEDLQEHLHEGLQDICKHDG